MGAPETTQLETIQVSRPNAAILLAEADKAKSGALALVIDSDEMYAVAADELKDVKQLLKQRQEQMDNLVRPLNSVIAGIRELFKPALTRLEEAEKAIKNAMLTYSNKKAEEARAEQRRRDEEARRQREEQERAAAEARRQAEEAAAAGRAEEAERLQAQADVQEATAAVIVAPPAVAAAPKVAGLSIRRQWKCELPTTPEDKAKALRHIAEHPEFLHLVEFSAKECNALAKAMKQNMVIPGLKAVEEQIVGSRSS